MKLVWYLSLFFLLQAVEGSVDADSENDWKNFKKEFNKTYKAEHEPMRRKIFDQKVKVVKKHNEAAAKGNFTFTLGLNHFSDMTDEEIVSKYTGFRPTPRNKTNLIAETRDDADRQLPRPYVNWRGDRCIAPVRDQLQCAACYAFAATAALEFALCKKYGFLKQLSEQHLIDCSGQKGCVSGHFEDSWVFVHNVPGQATRSAYPYIARVGACRNYATLVPRINPNDRPYNNYYIQSEYDMAVEIANGGPITVGYHAVSSFFNYKSGVYYDTACNSACTQANHAFTLVGYGTETTGIPYWIMRNSWSTRWGDLGYAKIRRGRNTCNIACWASRVLV